MLEEMPLPRFQLFELEDLPWFPRAIRDLATDYLHFVEKRFHLHKPVVPLLRRGLEKSNLASVVDLCSGGGGPVSALHEELLASGVAVQFTLTDKYPNSEPFGDSRNCTRRESPAWRIPWMRRKYRRS